MRTTIIVVLIIVGIGMVAFILALLFFFWNSSPFSNGAKAIDKNISNQYYYKEEGVVFVSGANFFSLGARKMENADPVSFEVLAYNLAKDNNHVYYNEMIIENADPKTFTLVSGELYDEKYTFYIYTKDTERVFYLYQHIKEADTHTYQHLWGDFSKDGTALFYKENKIADVSKNPTPIKNDKTGDYLSMSETVYFQGEPIQEALVNTFTVIKEGFSKDNHAVYFQNRLLKDVDPSSFEILNPNYQRDKNRLYYQTKALFQSDPDSYKLINGLFSKDKNHLYYIGSIVMDANPENYGLRQVERLDNDLKLVNLHYDDDYTLFAKRNELIEISRNHELYKGEVYCLRTRIIGADHKSFKVLEGSEEMYAKDKNQIFYHSIIIKDADTVSFKAINSKFAKDKNYVYYFEKPLFDIDPDTFIYQEDMYGETIDATYDRLVYP